MIVKTDCETDGSFYSTTSHLQRAQHADPGSLGLLVLVGAGELVSSLQQHLPAAAHRTMCIIYAVSTHEMLPRLNPRHCF